MAIYELTKEALTELPETAFEVEGLREREDIQRLLRERIEIVCPDIMVIAEEFGDWEEARRRIDLLALDRDANLVVIELKRTSDGGHMELQAIRYAAMVSAMTFDNAVVAHARYLSSLGREEEDAEKTILSFLGWKTSNQRPFGQDIRILLVSRDFSKELTSTVMWLNDHDLDIRCVRITPYRLDDRVLVDVQQIIPLPEAADYQVQVRSKAIRERSTRRISRDWTKYDLQVGTQRYPNLPKGRLILEAIRHACSSGISPEKIDEVIGPKTNLWFSVDGECDGMQVRNAIDEDRQAKGTSDTRKRFFWEDEELIRHKGKTYALTSQWGSDTLDSIDKLRRAFPQLSIDYSECEN